MQIPQRTHYKKKKKGKTKQTFPSCHKIFHASEDRTSSGEMGRRLYITERKMMDAEGKHLKAAYSHWWHGYTSRASVILARTQIALHSARHARLGPYITIHRVLQGQFGDYDSIWFIRRTWREALRSLDHETWKLVWSILYIYTHGCVRRIDRLRMVGAHILYFWACSERSCYPSSQA